MSIQLSDPTVIINNNTVTIMPNSLVFTEGLGEQNMRAGSTGGGGVEQIYSNNLESNFSTIKFDLPADIDRVELAREWKVLQNANLVQIIGTTTDGKVLTRTFQNAAILNDYEVALGSDTVIPIEFKASPAI